MEIFWTRKQGKEIDIARELELVAYIDPNGRIAIVSTDNYDEPIKEVLKTNNIDTEVKDLIKVKIYPLSLMPENLFDVVESNYRDVMEKFSKKFCDKIRKIIDDCEDSLRSERIRVLWAFFLDGSLNNSEILNAVENSKILEPEIIAMYRQMEKKVMLEILELILDYQCHFILWEEEYSTLDIILAVANDLSKKQIESVIWKLSKDRKEAQSEVIKKSGFSKSTLERRIRSCREEIDQIVTKDEIINKTRKIECEIFSGRYNGGKSINWEKYRIFYYASMRKMEDKSISLLFALYYKYLILYKENNEQVKQKAMEAKICNDGIEEVDLLFLLTEKVVVSVEIVHMILNEGMKINRELVNEECNQLQLQIIPMLKAMVSNMNKEKTPFKEMYEIIKKEDTEKMERLLEASRESSIEFQSFTIAKFFEEEEGYRLLGVNILGKRKYNRDYWGRRRKGLLEVYEEKEEMQLSDDFVYQIKKILETLVLENDQFAEAIAEFVKVLISSSAQIK